MSNPVFRQVRHVAPVIFVFCITNTAASVAPERLMSALMLTSLSILELKTPKV